MNGAGSIALTTLLLAVGTFLTARAVSADTCRSFNVVVLVDGASCEPCPDPLAYGVDSWTLESTSSSLSPRGCWTLCSHESWRFPDLWNDGWGGSLTKNIWFIHTDDGTLDLRERELYEFSEFGSGGALLNEVTGGSGMYEGASGRLLLADLDVKSPLRFQGKLCLP